MSENTSKGNDHDMDVDMATETEVTSSGPYVASTLPGKPHLINQLEFKDDFEEEEAQLSGNEDDDEDDDDIDDDEDDKGVKARVEGDNQGIKVSEWLDKSIDEEDEEDGDYVPEN